MARPNELHRQKLRSKLLAILRDRARKGERCPTRIEMPALGIGEKGLLPNMAREGLFKLMVGGRNFRVVEIDGMRTQAPPGWTPLYEISGRGKVLR